LKSLIGSKKLLYLDNKCLGKKILNIRPKLNAIDLIMGMDMFVESKKTQLLFITV